MSVSVYEFPNVNTKLEGTLVIKGGAEPLYFPQDYMSDWDGGDLDESESMSADDGRIGENDAEIIEDWLEDWDPESDEDSDDGETADN